MSAHVTRTCKSAAAKLLALAGYRMEKIVSTHSTSFSSALKRLAARGPGLFNTVIDIGASDGQRTRAMMQHFPDAEYFLVEAQPVHEPALKAFCAGHPNARYIRAAAGAEEGELFFDASDPFAGVASYVPVEGKGIRVPVTTLDHQVKVRQLRSPFLIKFDTHGFEVPILRGAADTLRETGAVVMECYNFKIAPESLLFYEMCALLAAKGFRPIDMFDVFCRPLDDALWQMDCVFLRDTRPEFQSSRYR